MPAAAISLGFGHPPGKEGTQVLLDVHLHPDSPGQPISMGEQWGSAGSIGAGYTLQQAAAPRHEEHLKACGCEWLMLLAAAERAQGRVFTPEEIWARKPASPPPQQTQAPTSKPSRLPIDDAEVLATIHAAIQMGDFEVIESLRDHLNKRIVREVVATWHADLPWNTKDAYAALLMDQTGEEVRPLFQDALHAPTAETRAYALCVLMEDFALFDSIMSAGGVDAVKVDAAIAKAGLR
jgi:hypothetical protein